MSLATERQRRRLICTCTIPWPRTVVLFGFLELTDVFECGDCGRPVMHPRTPGALADYHEGTA